MMMPWECKNSSDVAMYVLSNLKEPKISHSVLFDNQTWFLCLAYHENMHHLNLYRLKDGTKFAFHIGRSWANHEPPNMGTYSSIGGLVDSVVKIMWKRWESKSEKKIDCSDRLSQCHSKTTEQIGMLQFF